MSIYKQLLKKIHLKGKSGITEDSHDKEKIQKEYFLNCEKILSQKIQKIAILRFRSIGDTVLTLPVVKAIREKFPLAEITYITEPFCFPVLENNPDIDRIFVLDRKKIRMLPKLAGLREEWNFFRKLKKQKFDLVIDLLGGTRSAVAGFMSQSPFRIGYNYRGRSALYSVVSLRPETTLRMAEYHFYMLQGILKISGESIKKYQSSLHLSLRELKQGENYLKSKGINNNQYVLFHSGGSDNIRCIPPNKATNLLRKLLDKFPDLKIIMGWSFEEAGENQKIIDSLPLAQQKKVINGSNDRISLREMAVLMKNTLCHIGIDSGPMHIAALMKTPQIICFGPSNLEVWEPWQENAIIIKNQCECSPCVMSYGCTNSRRVCMEDLNEELILNSIIKKISGGKNGVEIRRSV